MYRTWHSSKGCPSLLDGKNNYSSQAATSATTPYPETLQLAVATHSLAGANIIGISHSPPAPTPHINEYIYIYI